MAKKVRQVLTVRLPIREPTKRKQERMLNAVNEANDVARTVANRMPGIPRRTWTASKAPVYESWTKELNGEMSLPSWCIRQTTQAVRETFCSWKSHGYPGNSPELGNWTRCAYNDTQPKLYRQPGEKWFLSLPMESGRGQREQFPLTTGAYHEDILHALKNNEVKQCYGGELILKNPEWIDGEPLATENSKWFFHLPVRYEKEVPDPGELDNVLAVKLARYQLATAALFPLNHGDDANTYEDIEQVKFLQSGREVRYYRDQLNDRRRRFQERGNLRKVREMRNLERRYVDSVTHTISRRAVDLALDAPGKTGVVLENLAGIRGVFMGEERSDTRALHSWPFAELGDRIRYKALKAGVPVFNVSPVRDARWCSKCGHKAQAEGKRNWTPGFRCSACGYEVTSRYVNSCRNVARRFGEQELEEEIHYAEEKELESTKV